MNRRLNGEFGNQYRVGQLLPEHAIALRKAAEARMMSQTDTNRSELITRAVDEMISDLNRGISRLHPLEAEDSGIVANRSKSFSRISR